MKSPAFQFYPNDFLGSGAVAAMTLEEVGAYWILLCYDWNECGLPDDMRRLARWCKVTEKRFTPLWEVVRENFMLRDGRWYNPRLERERVKQTENRQKKSDAAHARWERERVESESNAGALQTECPPSSSSSSPSGSKPKGRGKAAPFMGNANAVWRKHYPDTDPPKGSATALRPLYDRMAWDEADKHLDAYLAETPAQFINLDKLARTAGAEPKGQSRNGASPDKPQRPKVSSAMIEW